MLTEKIADAIAASGIKRGVKSGQASLSLKAASDTIVTPDPGEIQYSPDVVLPPRRTQVRDLIPEYPASAGSVGFYEVSGGSYDSPSFGVVDEDGAKPQDSWSATLNVVPLVTVAGIMKASDEILDDYQRLSAAIRQAGVDNKNAAIEIQLLNGTGNDGQIRGFQRWAIPGLDENVDVSLSEMEADGYEPDAIVMSPEAFRYLSNTYNISPISYSTGITRNPSLFGVPVIMTPVAGDLVLAGDFRRGARIYTRGTLVEIGYDADDFSHDRVTIRVSERLALAVVDRNAFRIGGGK